MDFLFAELINPSKYVFHHMIEVIVTISRLRLRLITSHHWYDDTVTSINERRYLLVVGVIVVRKAMQTQHQRTTSVFKRRKPQLIVLEDYLLHCLPWIGKAVVGKYCISISEC